MYILFNAIPRAASCSNFDELVELEILSTGTKTQSNPFSELRRPMPPPHILLLVSDLPDKSGDFCGPFLPSVCRPIMETNRHGDGIKQSLRNTNKVSVAFHCS